MHQIYSPWKGIMIHVRDFNRDEIKIFSIFETACLYSEKFTQQISQPA